MLTYPNENYLKKLATKAPGAVPAGFPARRSDCKNAVFGGVAKRDDELKYLRNQNGDASTVNRYLSDAWNKFATGQGVVGSRADQEQREFFDEKTFP